MDKTVQFLDCLFCPILYYHLHSDDEINLVNKLYKTNDPNLEKVRVNPKLKEAVFKDKESYGFIQMDALYVYIKLCKLLTYDDEFFVSNQTGSSAEFHEDISHIYDITPENNKVVCYEFAAIYEALLNEIGIPAEIIKGSNDYDTYGGEYTSVRFKVYGSIITVDSTTSILNGDLFAAKLNLNLSGINCVFENGRPNLGMITQSLIDSIYEDINVKEHNSASNIKGLDDLLDEYGNQTENIKDVSLKDKIEILINMVNSTNLKGIDAYAYLLYLKRNILINEPNFKMNIIRDDTSEVRTARTIISIKIKDKNNKEFYLLIIIHIFLINHYLLFL